MSFRSGLIYDWNQADGPEWASAAPPRLDDETLRDGLQSPSVLDPPIEKKLCILHLPDPRQTYGPLADRRGNVGTLRAEEQKAIGRKREPSGYSG
jgi:hypothetical protein